MARRGSSAMLSVCVVKLKCCCGWRSLSRVRAGVRVGIRVQVGVRVGVRGWGEDWG